MENIVVMNVTPELAKTWLDNSNIINRKISKQRVVEIANDIKNGKWKVTCEPISFLEDGSLADGQHRLLAICLAGIAVKTAIATGISKDAAGEYNNSRPDSVINKAYKAGLDEKYFTRPIISTINSYRRLSASTTTGSTSSIYCFDNVIKKHEEALNYLQSCGAFVQSGSGRITSPAVVNAVLIAAYESGVDTRDISDFLDTFRLNETYANRNNKCVLAFRERIKSRGSYGNSTTITIAMDVEDVFNAYRFNKRSVTKTKDSNRFVYYKDNGEKYNRFNKEENNHD